MGPVMLEATVIMAASLLFLQGRRCHPGRRKWAIPALSTGMVSIIIFGLYAVLVEVPFHRDLYLFRGDLTEKDLRGFDLNYAYLKEAKLDRANLQGASMENAVMAEASFTGADLRDTRMSEADARGVDQAHAAGEFDVYPGQNPHEAELTIDGTLLVAVHRPSAVVEVDVDTQEVLWAWSPTTDGAGKIRDANRLPNGNTLITSTSSIYEVTPAGEVAWRLDSNYEEDPDSPVDLRPFYKAVLLDEDGVQYGD